MAQIKSYTDLSQSKKLAEILPLESADYCWGLDDETLQYNNSPYPCAWKDYSCKEYYIPCWSLAALLNVLPSHIYDKTGRKELGMDKSDTYYNVFYENKNSYIQKRADNPVDACVAMVEKLHELKML